MMIYRYTAAAYLCVATSLCLAQVEVVDRDLSVAAKKVGLGDQAYTAQLYIQLQSMQQEVQELRGLVEQQSHELKRLKQQRLDDYLDLDSRLSNLPGASSTGGIRSGVDKTVSANVVTPAVVSGVRPKDERALYHTAIDFVLKKRDYDSGITALNNYLSEYPKGFYTPNARYWLGQIYFQKSDYTASVKWFEAVVNEYPGHRKAAESKFKLAKSLHLLGDSVRAKQLLDEVVAAGSPAAELAQSYLDKHY